MFQLDSFTGICIDGSNNVEEYNEQINYDAVCKIASATPGLFNISQWRESMHNVRSFFKLILIKNIVKLTSRLLFVFICRVRKNYSERNKKA